LYKGRNKNPIVKSGSDTLSKQMRVINWKQYHETKVKVKSKEAAEINFWRRLHLIYMDEGAAIERIKELETLLNSHYIITALPYLRLKYISQDKLEDAEKIKILVHKITDTFKDSII